MPPRASKRKSTVVAVDLTLSSSDYEGPALKKTKTKVVAKAKTPRKSRARKVEVELPAGGTGAEEEQKNEDGDADLEMARKLQRELDEEDGMQVDGDHISAPIASTSGSSRPRRTAPAAASTSSAKARVICDPSDAQDPKTILSEYRPLFVGGTGKCPCGAIVQVDTGADTPSLTSQKAKDAFLALATAECSACDKKLCRGCWEPVGADGQCCAAGRAIVLYNLLCAFDKKYLEDRLHKPVPRATKPVAKRGRGKAKSDTRGTGYGTGQTGGGGMGYPLGMGYGQDYFDEEDGGVHSDEYGNYPSDEEGEYAASIKHAQAMVAAAQKGRVAAAQAAVPVVQENAKDLALDKVITGALKILAALLPHPDHADAQVFDYLPHPSIAPLLLVSTIPDLLTDLLRNDSVSEWTKRSEVYFATLDVLTGLSESEATLAVLFGERRDKKWSEGLAAWMQGEGDVQWDRKFVPPPPKKRGRKRKADASDDDTAPSATGDLLFAPSLYSHLKRLVTQAEAFRRAATTGEFDADDTALLGLCGDFSTAGERAHRMLQIWTEQQERDGTGPRVDRNVEVAVANGNGKGKARAVEPHSWSFDEYAAACRSLAYDTVTLSEDVPGGGKTFLTHHYNVDLAATAASKRPHGGFVHLAKELAVLSTSLPPGIFLRVDEARIDAIKCIIAGPEGTPYAGGLFEFDIFVPLQYPQVPPHVWLRTTGGGQVRYNPNLYAEGKVCLSILGTWAGSPDEMWKPGTSTLLQVLISIQAMILGTSMPYFNEPGFGVPKDNKQNKDYNANVALATVKHAMIHWHEDAFKDGIWGDVIAMHFTFHHDTIAEQIANWASKDHRMTHWTTWMNSLCGNTHLVAYNPSAQHQLAAYVAGGGQAPGGRAAAPTGAPAETDLPKMFEEGCDRVTKWRKPVWYRELTA